MTPGDLIITAYITLLSAGLGTLFWTRLNRLEDQLSDKASVHDLRRLRADGAEFRAEVAQDFGQLRAEVAEDLGQLRADVAEDLGQLRAEVAQFRAEAREDSAELRRELAGLRSDLTQVALAVGAGRPTASEG